MGYITFENNGQPAINDTNLNLMQVELMKMVFPVGSTYITQENVNPSTILNFGTWERLKGKVCLGLDEDDTDLNTIGETGGEKKHILNYKELPSTIIYNSVKSSDESIGEYLHLSDGGNLGWAVTQDGYYDKAHNNMQPYEVVGYMWIRRA